MRRNNHDIKSGQPLFFVCFFVIYNYKREEFIIHPTSMPAQKKLSAQEHGKLLGTLKQRFTAYPSRHKGITRAKVQERLEAKPEKLRSLHQMEQTGGEPDVVGYDKKS